MHPDDQDKTVFVTDWGVYVIVVMMFGLTMMFATFQQTITQMFGEYIAAFMQVFLDDFAVYGTKAEHLAHLQLYLERCCTSRISLNPTKFSFGITSGACHGHIVSREGITVDLKIITTILDAKTPTIAKALNYFLCQLRCHSCMLRYLVDFARRCTSHTFQVDDSRRKSVRCTQDNVNASTDRATTRLGETIPCLCGCLRYSNRQRIDAAHGTRLAQTGLLC